MLSKLQSGWFIVLLGMSFATAAPPQVVKHVDVFKEDGRFGGWPANNGIWVWDNEILVGFTLGYHKKNPKGGHDIDPDRPSTVRQARSLDGGETWKIEDPAIRGGADQDLGGGDLDEPVDFSNPDVAVRLRNTNVYYSADRGGNWNGPYQLPKFGRPGLLARTDYLIEGPHRLTAFVAAQKQGGGEGQPLCIRTTDGGLTWHRVGWIGRQPPKGYGYAIMPATVAIPDDGYLSIIRRGGVFDGVKKWWIEPYLSPDAGKSWYLLVAPTIDNAGNPASMIRLSDGRLAMVYGWRHAPYGIRGRLSDDNGQSWGGEFVLRHDGASWDIGYPRTVQRADGKCVTVYYYHHADQPERYIAATIWEPGDGAD